jgi:hypothetical protein
MPCRQRRWRIGVARIRERAAGGDRRDLLESGAPRPDGAALVMQRRVGMDRSHLPQRDDPRWLRGARPEPA